MSNYDKLLHVISKWHFNPSTKNMNYGNFLRQAIKHKDVQGNIFPGDNADNSEKLESLLRLVNNSYGRKFPVNKTTGASGIKFELLETVLSDEFVEYFKKKSKFFS